MVLRRSRFPLLVHKLIRYIFQNVFYKYFFREKSCYFSDNSLRKVLNLTNYLYQLSQYMSLQYFRMKRTKQCTVLKACQIQTCTHKIHTYYSVFYHYIVVFGISFETGVFSTQCCKISKINTCSANTFFCKGPFF